VTQLEVDDMFEDVHRSGLFVHEINDGAPGARVILVHGAPDRSKNFARVLDELGLASPVTIYDRRGYGRSMDAGALGGGFTQHAEDLIDIIDQQPAIVIGQSAGGAIALQASIMAPDKFLALGVWEPPMVAHEWWGGRSEWHRTQAWVAYSDMERVGEDINRSIIGNERWDSLTAETKDLLRSEGRAFWADMESQTIPLFNPEQVTVPVIVGKGTVHSFEHLGVAHRRLSERLSAPLWIGEGASHAAHVTHAPIWADFTREVIHLARSQSGVQVRWR
jgi:pimeloyl-ACP methyl ester carboxylesterase